MRKEVYQLTEAFSVIFKTLHQRSYQKLSQYKLYPGQPKILSLIKSKEGITQKELAEKNSVTPATITGMLSKLEANHYLYRVPDEEDKRILRVYLTPEGRLMADQAEVFMDRLTESLFDDFTEEELSTYLRLTEKIKQNLNRQEPK